MYGYFILKYMTVKTLTIKEEVYNVLKKLKRDNESFSDLLLRLANQINGQNLENFLGAWDVDNEEIQKINQNMEIIKKKHAPKLVKLE
jgi:predicted CopG family antitoxin